MFARRRNYHEWPASTPVIDVVRVIVAAASVMIGAYALVFMAFAVRDGDSDLTARYSLFLGGVVIANLLVEMLRRWRRHHG